MKHETKTVFALVVPQDERTSRTVAHFETRDPKAHENMVGFYNAKGTWKEVTVEQFTDEHGNVYYFPAESKINVYRDFSSLHYSRVKEAAKDKLRGTDDATRRALLELLTGEYAPELRVPSPTQCLNRSRTK